MIDLVIVGLVLAVLWLIVRWRVPAINRSRGLLWVGASYLAMRMGGTLVSTSDTSVALTVVGIILAFVGLGSLVAWAMSGHAFRLVAAIILALRPNNPDQEKIIADTQGRFVSWQFTAPLLAGVAGMCVFVLWRFLYR